LFLPTPRSPKKCAQLSGRYLYAFSVFATYGPLFELTTRFPLQARQYIHWLVLAVALTPLGLALLAWHQFRSYTKVLKPR
jgi:hypothetical protein